MNFVRNFFRISYGEKRPWLLEIRSSTTFIIITVCTAIFTDIFLYAVIVPVFPFSLVTRVGVDPSSVQHWISILLSVYAAAILGVAPICGYLSDIITFRRGPLLAGMVVLTGATVMLCLAKTLPVLITGRVLQGASAGVIWVVGLALLADTVGKESAGQVMGYVGVAYSVSALIAPLLGGIVYARSGYYSVFAMTFGIMALDICLRLLLIEKKAAKRWLPDPDPTPVSVPATSEQARAEKQVGLSANNGPTPDDAEGPIEDSSAPVKKKLPAILTLLKSRRMQATFWASTVDAMILTGFDTTLPLFVEQTFGWNSLGAGLLYLALTLAAFAQPFYGWLVDREGPRYIAFAGQLICIPAFVCLRFITNDSMAHKVLFCFLLTMIGFGISITLAGAMAEFTYICVEKERKKPGSMGKGGAYAQSYSLFNITWALGSLIGAYFAGGIRQSAGWATMSWAFALVCGVVSIPTLLFMDGWIGDNARKNAERKKLRAERRSLEAATASSS